MPVKKGTKHPRRAGRVHFVIARDGSVAVYAVDAPLTEAQLRSIAAQLWEWAGKPTGTIQPA